MKNYFLSFFCLLLPYSVQAQTMYSINIDRPEKKIVTNHLDLGGTNPSGEKISVNSYFIEKNGKPFIPIIGEFHYSRYSEKYWEEEILKMKAGGINVIATYVFWNIHERQEGVFDWSGDLNLRKFIELVGKHQLYAIVRMGPFCHGEIRNGGLPDWIYGRSFEVRSNDPEYLEYVDRLYGEIAKQIDGLQYKDGGPVVGVQLENEYQHSAAPWEFNYPGSVKEYTVADWDAAIAHEQISGTDGKNPQSAYGKKHMDNLKGIAKKQGIDVPIYTTTGWGNATIVEKGSIPVTAGYAYPFWEDPHASPFYLFKDIHKYPDYSPISYDAELYPSIPGEIGPGIQPKYSRRPVVDFKSVNPLMVRIIGSGSNGIGYYMYHGGSTPQFEGKFFNEEVNGLPRVNYDFQAPIGQYGQIRYHYKHLRLLHLFLEAYGDRLAPMKTILPETNASITPENTKTLRYAVRSYGDTGFLFMINFQDHLEVEDMKDVSLKVETSKEIIQFPASGSFDVPKTTSAILPFNLKLGKALLKSSTVQPLTILHPQNTDFYVFSSIDGIKPELSFHLSTKISGLMNAMVTTKNNVKTVYGKADQPFFFVANGEQFLILPQSMAMNAVKMNEHLVVTDGFILPDLKDFQLISRNTENKILIFPDHAIALVNEYAQLKKTETTFKYFGSYTVTFKEVKPEVTFEKISDKKYELKLKSDIEQLNDVFVDIDFTGDRGLAFIKGELITDYLYQGRKWEIGLKQFANKLQDDKMLLMFYPLYDTYTYLEDLKTVPAFKDGKCLKINGMDVIPEYKARLNW